MLGLLKSSAKDTIIYSIGTFSSRLVSLVLIPLYTSKFTVNDYGILGISEISIQLLTIFIGLALYNGFFRWYWDDKYKKNQKSIFFSLHVVVVLFGSSIGVLFFVFKQQLSSLLYDSPDFQYLLMLVFIVGFLESFIILDSTLLRLRQKAAFFTILSLLKLTVSLLFNIYFIVYKGKGIAAVYESQIISCVVYLIGISFYILKNIKIKFEYRIVREIVNFSFPLLLTGVAGISLSVTDRYILKYLTDFDTVGIYTLGFKLSNTLRVFVITSVNMAIMPIIFKMIDKPGNKRFYSKIMTYYTFGLLFFVMFFSVFSRELVDLISKNNDYIIAYTVVPIISYGLLFTMLRDMALTGINIMKKTKVTAITLFVVASISILLNFLFIPLFNYYGAAISMLVSNIIYFGIIYVKSQKYYYIPFELKKIITMILISVVLIAVSLAIPVENALLKNLIKLIIIGVFPLILWPLNFYEQIEKQRLKEFYEKWKNPLKWNEHFRKIVNKNKESRT